MSQGLTCSLLLLLAFPAARVPAQALSPGAEGSTSAAATTNDTGPLGIIPYVKGPNLSLAISSQHDSSNGWSSTLTPDLAWRFNRLLAADLSTPVFTDINVVLTSGTSAKPIYTNATRHFVFGDTALNGHLDLPSRFADYNLTLSLGLPTGNDAYGLGAGKVTYNLNNHLEKSLGLFSPDLELGLADSSALIGARIRRGYTTDGTLAHFQAGTSVDLPFNLGFEADAYEELPISSQTLYSTTGKGKKKVTTATQSSLAEDNGFNTSLDIPLNRHTTLSGFYSRSLRSHIDTAGFSLTCFLRPAPHPKEQ